MTPFNFKIFKIFDNFMIKHFFSYGWVAHGCVKVKGWVVQGGAPWGRGKGVKLAKIHILMEVVVKNDENSKHQFSWSNKVVT